MGFACLPRIARSISQDKIKCNRPPGFMRSNREALVIRKRADVEGKGEVLISLLQCLAKFLAVSETRHDLNLVQ